MLRLSIIASTAAGTRDPVDALWYPSIIPRSIARGLSLRKTDSGRWSPLLPAPWISQMSDIALTEGLTLCEPNHIDHRWGSLGRMGVILTN